MLLLFSYGTLQQADVQLATFGRLLVGKRDELIGFVRDTIEIEEEDVVATSGKAVHPIVRRTGVKSDCVSGTVYEVSEKELSKADGYEVDAYKRVVVELVSGAVAWVYVDARFE